MTVNAFVGSNAGAGAPLPQYTPDNVVFNYSDYCSVAVSVSAAHFTRPTVDGQGYAYTNPGARVRFKTDASSFTLRLQYTNLVTRLDTYNAIGVVLANGSVAATFTRSQGAAGPLNLIVNLGSSSLRTIEVVMPYCASVDFVGVDLPAGALFQAPTARPATRFVAMGDSITQGFLSSEVDKEWPFLLAQAKNYQLINHGYGGRQCVPADGTTLANLSPSVATYLIGYNDFYAQTPLATFSANYTAFINNFRAINSTAKLYCITPTYSPNTAPLTLANYRTQIVNALAALANPLNVLVDGLSIMTNDNSRLVDTIHPNDTGSSEIATALGPIVIP